MSQAPPLEPGLVFSLLGDIYSHTASATLEPTCLHTVAEKFGSVENQVVHHVLEKVDVLSPPSPHLHCA